jgi:hypothetical protein
MAGSEGNGLKASDAGRSGDLRYVFEPKANGQRSIYGGHLVDQSNAAQPDRQVRTAPICVFGIGLLVPTGYRTLTVPVTLRPSS